MYDTRDDPMSDVMYRLTGMNPMSWVPQTPFGSGTSTVTASS